MTCHTIKHLKSIFDARILTFSSICETFIPLGTWQTATDTEGLLPHAEWRVVSLEWDVQVYKPQIEASGLNSNIYLF